MSLPQEKTSVIHSEDYLEMCFIVDAANLDSQGGRGSHMVYLVLPQLGEHLCVRSHLAPGKKDPSGRTEV